MPAALDVDRDAVKAHVLTHGVREAARAYGLSENTVAAWSARGKWLQPAREAAAQPITAALPQSMQPIASGAIKPSEAARNSLQKLSERSRLNAAKTVDRGFKAAVKKPGEWIVAAAPALASLAKVGTTAFPDWQQASHGPLVSIQLLTVEQPAQAQVTTVEHAPMLDLPE